MDHLDGILYTDIAADVIDTTGLTLDQINDKLTTKLK